MSGRSGYRTLEGTVSSAIAGSVARERKGALEVLAFYYIEERIAWYSLQIAYHLCYNGISRR